MHLYVPANGMGAAGTENRAQFQPLRKSMPRFLQFRLLTLYIDWENMEQGKGTFKTHDVDNICNEPESCKGMGDDNKLGDGLAWAEIS